ncbi:MAG: hypothetical protein GX287_05840 [Fusobacteria bacterium]|nr:hypothetical protein [Fusobacteriota bacterium]
MENIYIKREALSYPKMQFILNRINSHGCTNYKIVENEEEYRDIICSKKIGYKEQKRNLFFGLKKGNFLKKYYLDKNFLGIKEEYYLSYEKNCPYNCTYCYLRDYYDNGAYHYYVNTEDMYRELDAFKKSGTMISAGIVNDTLAYDYITYTTKDLIHYFKNREDLILEIRTKSTNINNLLREEPSKNVVIAFSFNPESIINKYENNTAIFKKRVEAVKELQEKGYYIGLRFDPMIYDPNDVEHNNYKEMINYIFKNINLNKIKDIGIGSLRYKKSLKEKVLNDIKTDLFYSEMVIGIDGKERYFKPIRISLYKSIVNEIKKYGDFNIYLGMEPEYVWKEVLG